MKNPFSQHHWAWITVLIFEAVQALSLFPWLIMAGLAVMAFDAPGSTQLWQPWAFVLAIWSYPLWLLAAGVVSWFLLSLRKPKSAVALTFLMTLPMPAFFVAIFLGI
ncbi:MAG: hypothetical protein Fur0032_22590 [Terrimicrobiaceae bacterium]